MRRSHKKFHKSASVSGQSGTSTQQSKNNSGTGNCSEIHKDLESQNQGSFLILMSGVGDASDCSSQSESGSVGAGASSASPG